MLLVRTLGGLSALHEAHEAVPAIQPRRLAVLALVARSGRRGITRDRLLALLWPDAEEEAARKALNQALYMLRRDTATDALFEGVQELRLNAEVARCDAVDFEAACTAGELEQAAALYDGPFLDGFRLPGAPEFDRWVDEERAALAYRYAGLLEQLARQAAGAGEAQTAVVWWRKLAAQDPLNSRVAVELMEALLSTGDRSGALQHARIYEALMEQELQLPPDEDVVALAERIRRAPAVAARPGGAPAAVIPPAEVQTPQPPAATAASVAAPAPSIAESTPHVRPEEAQRPRFFAGEWIVRRAAALAVLIVGLVSMGVTLGRLRPGATPVPTAAAEVPAAPVLAVGRISDYTGSESGAAALADMLATNLARADGLRVISTPRLYALLQNAAQQADFGTAALEAGAGILVEGALYGTAGGALRLDLRRIDLASGTVLDAHTVEGAELFVLADAGTERLVAALGLRAPGGSVAGLTTRSVTAYRLYEQGLRAFAQQNLGAARPLFEAAVAEDSAFAMAAYYAAIVVRDDVAMYLPRMHRALQLAEHASDRERLIIRTSWAFSINSPGFYALADSLVTRYPEEVDGYLHLGSALVHRGEFLAALPHLQHVVEMDSLTIARGSVPCSGCDALSTMMSAYMLADSLDAAIRTGQRWVALQPLSSHAWWRLGDMFGMAGRHEEALHATRRAAELEPGRPHLWSVTVARGLRTADFAAVDAQLRTQLEIGPREERGYARWLLILSLRNQGRLEEAVAEARRYRAEHGPPPAGEAVHHRGVAEAQALFEAGEHRRAAALFDSIARWPFTGEPESVRARHRAWYGTHAASSLAAAGAATGLPARADSIARWSTASSLGRDARLHHHVRGLLLSLERRDDLAIEELRRAIYSPTGGYTRTNLELARASMRLQRPAEAVAVLQPALRGPLEASNFYVTHTELHEALALAWDAAGVADSAAAHYDWVVRAWQRADPELQPRRLHAQQRLAALRGR